MDKSFYPPTLTLARMRELCAQTGAELPLEELSIRTHFELPARASRLSPPQLQTIELHHGAFYCRRSRPGELPAPTSAPTPSAPARITVEVGSWPLVELLRFEDRLCACVEEAPLLWNERAALLSFHALAEAEFLTTTAPRLLTPTGSRPRGIHAINRWLGRARPVLAQLRTTEHPLLTSAALARSAELAPHVAELELRLAARHDEVLSWVVEQMLPSSLDLGSLPDPLATLLMMHPDSHLPRQGSEMLLAALRRARTAEAAPELLGGVLPRILELMLAPTELRARVLEFVADEAALGELAATLLEQVASLRTQLLAPESARVGADGTPGWLLGHSRELTGPEGNVIVAFSKGRFAIVPPVVGRWALTLPAKLGVGSAPLTRPLNSDVLSVLSKLWDPTSEGPLSELALALSTAESVLALR